MRTVFCLSCLLLGACGGASVGRENEPGSSMADRERSANDDSGTRVGSTESPNDSTKAPANTGSPENPGDPTGTINDPTTEVLAPAEVTELVVAEDGGELTLDDGTTLSVPPGALNSDAEITLVRETCAGVYASRAFPSCRYGVEAPGAELDGEFTLSLPRTQGAAESSACLAAWSDEGFVCLAAADQGSDTVTAPASLLTSFVVMTTLDEVRDPQQVDLPFTPCGGDVIGDWSLVATNGGAFSFTSELPELDDYATCDADEHYQSYRSSLEETLSFQEGGWPTEDPAEVKNHFESNASEENFEFKVVTEGCLERVGETCSPDCNNHEGVCECLLPRGGGGGGGETFWWYADETTLAFFTTEYSYCVEDDMLSLSWTGGDEERVVVYARE